MAHGDNPLNEPRVIGPYKLLDVLGEGGMGVVYLAEQTVPVRRRVALKIVKLGMDTKQVIARFESERQALAVMDHPNIARALDGGVTEDGRPYFVMELVQGTPITDYADRHRLTTRARLELFIDVCHAVQHAHQKGVIHRDLKPSNVLVTVHDSGPTVKVIDFGIAKAVGMGLTDHTLVTRIGQMLGTPEYMSPEQAEMSGLDVDTRTDIYSLGVMLYELIVGALPFDLGAKPDYMISHTLRERDVPRPSTRLTGLGHTLPVIARDRRTTPETLRKELRGDLDWIILKAMDKDRTRRYDSATGLALDVERHLNDEPVLARPPTTQDRMTKFVRRNRVPVIAASLAMVAGMGGATAAAVGFVHAREEQRRAEQAAATAEEVTDFLTGLFRVSDPGEALGNTITAREVLDRGAGRILTELGHQPGVQARLMRTMGQTYHNLGLYGEAGRLFEGAAEVGKRLDPQDDLELAKALQRLGAVYRVQGRTAEAEEVLARSMDLSRNAGSGGAVTLAEAATVLANLYMVLGRYAEAEPLLNEAVALQESALGADHAALATTLGNLAALHLRQRQFDQAEPFLRRSIAINERTLGEGHPGLRSGLVNLGALHFWQERYDEAEGAWLRALRIVESTLDPDHLHRASILNNLGEIHWTRGEFEQAEVRLRQALGIKERALGPEHVEVAVTLKTLANVYRDQGRLAEAEPIYVRAIAVYDHAMDQPDAAVGETLRAYGKLLRATGRTAEAERLESRAASIGAGANGG
jgi:eukaryotic-like serine/threonine-protein kinase